jgi:hypothetical protein
MTAVAYANWGRWVADCPRPYCGSAEPLTLNQPWFTCRPEAGGCGAQAPIEWPPDAEQIEAALIVRENPRWMNWLPGETVADLHAETLAHATELAAWHGYDLERGAASSPGQLR